MLLNCDLGESYGSWTMGMDSEAMPYIDQANIACGFHAGDPMTMHNTLLLAAQHNVSVGAHPAYPDLVGFGRRSMRLTRREIICNLHYQIAALEGMAASTNLTVDYVKPHGALYNDMMAQPSVREAIMYGIASYHRPIPLVLQATTRNTEYSKEADVAGIQVRFEAFADRCYDDNGALLSRQIPGAVHSREDMLFQVRQLIDHNTVTTASGKQLQIQADTLCVHGDNAEGISAIKDIRNMMSAKA